MSKPRPDLSAGRSKRTKQTARYPAGWGQMVELNAVMEKDADQTELATDKLFQVSLFWNMAMRTGQEKNTTNLFIYSNNVQPHVRTRGVMHRILTIQKSIQAAEKCTDTLEYLNLFLQARAVEFSWYKSIIICRSKRELDNLEGYCNGQFFDMNFRGNNIEWISHWNCIYHSTESFPLYL